MPPDFEKLEAIHTMHRVIPAEDFNLVRLSLSRLGNPLELDLGLNLPCLEVLLSDRYWLCFDACQENAPIMAWTSFVLSERQGLHEPVTCVLRLYHIHAGLVMGEVFDSIGKELRKKLDASQGESISPN